MGQFDFMRMMLMPKFRPLAGIPGAEIDDPEQGKVSIGGTGGGVVDLNFSVSHSVNRQHAHEDKRVYDKIKIAYTRPDGTIDWSQWTEVEVVRQLSFGNGDKVAYAQSAVADNIELVAEGLTRYNR